MTAVDSPDEDTARRGVTGRWRRPRRDRWLIVAIVVAVLAVAAGSWAVLDGRAGDNAASTTAPTASPTTSAPAGTGRASTPPAPTGTVTPGATPTGQRGAGPVPRGSAATTSTPAAQPWLAYQLLWPFRDAAQARDWQAAGGGHQPWHLDAGLTALDFARGYLALSGIDRVTTRQIGTTDAHVGVGFARPEGYGDATAGVVHLVRLGAGSDAPWEVVGTRDADFSLLTPRYGTRHASPVTVGGRITGVDENIHVQVRQPSSARPIGESCCLPAGGTNQGWSTRVTYRDAQDPVLTVVAWTGGHLVAVERFTVTALLPVPAS
ncbi:hypothetical protein [Frankia sp. ACN1ag]|uniref:hypothetical protein n=1 Tax=Frankia sp. ACN1ag TaxID=102891 RepID=UPI00191BEC85|nr:hypothetical protein [Frankia sp. ACN1ag]